MTPDKALNRLAFRFKQWRVNEDDVKALNSLIVYVNAQKNKNLVDNDLFAKLFLERFIMLGSTGRRTARSCLDEIDNTLNKSVYDWVVKLKEEIPMMKFNTIGVEEFPFDESKWNNITYVRERANKVTNKYSEELLKSLRTEYTEEEVIEFVENQVNRIITKHNKD